MPSTDPTTTTATTTEPIPSRLRTHLLHPRALLIPTTLLGIILTAAASPPHFNNEVSDDGLGITVCLLALCAFGVTLVSELGLLVVPRVPRFKACFPCVQKRRSESRDEGAKGEVLGRLKLHPAVYLSIECVVCAMAVSLAVVDALLVGIVGMEALLVAAVAIQWIVVVGHGLLVGLAGREVHRLRGEQLRKRASLKAGMGREQEGEGGRLEGWVELEEGMGRGRGAGGGLGGKGGGL